MPKFLYTVIFINLITYGAIARIIFFKLPDSKNIVLLFIFLMGFAIFLTSSLILFFLNKRKNATFYNPRRIYRKELKKSLIIALGISGLALLRVFDLLNILTGGLFLVLFFSLFLATTSNNR